ncbi:hypothetical protein ISS85_01920 [Candidatus Microgenomates bacterium]|nr:hypothetical protein [Candidatus Microgenomates bacterium]
MIKLGAKELRKSKPNEQKIAKIKRNPIYIVLDNVLDTYNVGAIFRLADAMAVEMVYLCGGTATPDDPKVGHKIEKASVGTWKWVSWKYAETAVEAVEKIRNLKWDVRSGPPASSREASRAGKWDTDTLNFRNLEVRKKKKITLQKSQDIKNSTSKKSHLSHHTSLQVIAVEQDSRSIPYTEAKYEPPLAIVMGHETDGISKEVLDISDIIVEIPMWGVNKSLNVMVSSAIVLYEIMKRVDRKKRI